MQDTDIKFPDANEMKEKTNNERLMIKLLQDYVDEQYLYIYNNGSCDNSAVDIKTSSDGYIIVKTNIDTYTLNPKYLKRSNMPAYTNITADDIRGYLSAASSYTSMLKTHIDNFVNTCISGVDKMYCNSYYFLVISRDYNDSIMDSLLRISYVDEDIARNIAAYGRENRGNVLDDNMRLNECDSSEFCYIVSKVTDSSHIIGDSGIPNSWASRKAGVGSTRLPRDYEDTVIREFNTCICRYGTINIDRIYKQLRNAGYSVMYSDNGIVIVNDNL